MVTSNEMPDKKVVKMADTNNSENVPQRTLLGEVNEHITCPLCRGYYIDATTIVECLHSFCRSCIIKHLKVKSYCPVCEMMINSAKPNIKLDKALQDIVYKLVPGLFQREMERRQHFYSSRPGPAATATPEQRGEDTERIIFSPEDVISFSLEYADTTDNDSISSKSSDSNEPQPNASARRYLQCPAVVNISHLKKFLSMKFDIDSRQFAIDILYKRVPLPDYYSLMDIAYIYNWKRNEPMRFFYQIIDYAAIRNRIFDINRKSSHFKDRKSSPAPTEDANISSPAPNLNENVSEASSGTDSPMLDDNGKKVANLSKTVETSDTKNNDGVNCHNVKKITVPTALQKKDDEDDEKSQFLNSFELTAKNSSKMSPKSNKDSDIAQPSKPNYAMTQSDAPILKVDENLKRKLPLSHSSELKKLKVEIEKSKLPINIDGSTPAPASLRNSEKIFEKAKSIDEPFKKNKQQCITSLATSTASATKDIKTTYLSNLKGTSTENQLLKRQNSSSLNIPLPKRKIGSDAVPATTSNAGIKIVSPIKLQIPKTEVQSSTVKLSVKTSDNHRAVVKKMPDLKPSIPLSQTNQKTQQTNKVRMDLLANNSDPTIDRSKILSQVKTTPPSPNIGQSSGDPLKSLFDSCKINIPSSLSITLTDQKLESTKTNEMNTSDIKNQAKSAPNSALTQLPSPPVHNYIEILKLPEGESKPSAKLETNNESKSSQLNKNDPNLNQAKQTINKSAEISSKGPVPNLKPIADSKLGKQSGNYGSPITFQQTFEQQLQSLQSDKKVKLSKNKAQVPKLVPASPKTLSAANKLQNSSSSKLLPSVIPSVESKSSAALDLSTPHNVHTQLAPHQSKAFETMQSIANLAKKQCIPAKNLGISLSQGNTFVNRTLSTGSSPLRIPTSTINPVKVDKNNPNLVQTNVRPDSLNKICQPKHCSSTSPSPNYQISAQSSPSTAQPSPRQTRSPSSSPKLVIAEDKQAFHASDTIVTQSTQISSTQVSTSVNIPKNESPTASPGPSKTLLKSVKSSSLQAPKLMGIRQPITPTLKSNAINASSDFLSQPLLAHHALIRQQMEMNAWLKVQRQFDLFKNMSNISQQNQNDYNKEKQ